MATATIILSNSRIEGVNVYVAGSIVGTDPWSDADAATYTDVAASERTTPGVAEVDGLEVALADLSLDVDVATLNSITVDVDVVCTNFGGGAGSLYSIDVAFFDPVGDYVASFYVGAASAAPETLTSSSTTLGTDPTTLTAELLPALTDGAGSLRVGRLSTGSGVPADYEVRVTRLVLTIDYDPPVVTAGVPHRRIFQRAL